MRLLQVIRRKLSKFSRHAYYFPKLVARTIKRRRNQIGVNEIEAERLDRIREPWKYRGK